MNLYYADGERQVGPIGRAELKALIKNRQINAKSLVWEPGMESWQELGAYVRRKAHGKPEFEPSKSTASQAPCSQCGKHFNHGDMVRIKNVWVCASCKPFFLQKIKEGVQTGLVRQRDIYGSLEKGVKGRYEVNVSEILAEAWRMTDGSKLVVVGSLFLIWIFGAIIQNIVAIPLTILFGIFAATFKNILATPGSAIFVTAGFMLAGMLIGFISIFAQVPLWVGLEMIGVRRSVDLPVSFRYIFNYFKYFFKLALTWLLMCILIVLGFIFFIVPGIYLSVATFLALQLVADRKFGPWQAVKTSIQAITHKWFHVFLLLLAIFGIMAISMIPLGIGLIWTWPLFIISKGILYRNIFGVLASE